MTQILKKIFAVFLLMAVTCCYSISAEAAKKRVAVLPLENVSGFSAENVADIMAEELTSALLNSQKYTVIERSQIATILREQGFQNVTSDPSSAVSVGNLTGAEYSIIGKVTLATVVQNQTNVFLDIADPWKGKVSVEIRFVDNATGEIVNMENTTFEGSKAGNNAAVCIHGACKDAAEKFLSELKKNIMGNIAEVGDKEVYIDLGSDSGLRKGDVLLVVRETDPITIAGKIVGMKTIDIGRVKVTEVNAEYSVCKIDKVEKGQSIRKGDVVKPKRS